MAVLLSTAACSSTRAGYSTAPYTVVRSEGLFEVRDYPVLRVVETQMNEAARDGGFGRLFRYISGDNDQSRKIAMTTPVFMGGEQAERTMAFVLPEMAESARPPAPSDASVRVREIPEGRFAVLRFSGSRGAANEQEALGRLRAWLGEQAPGGEVSPVFGYFDPPWTPPFLRRNEVMLRLEREVSATRP